MRTILVTGGAGFIGSNFVRRLTARPQTRIVVLDLLTYAGNVANLPVGRNGDDRLQLRHGDVRNAVLVDSLVAESDVVVHLAAESHVTRSIFDDRLFFETDVLGTQTVATAVVKHRDRVERFLHVSSSEVYGTARTERMDERHALEPMSPYAAAKCGADRLVSAYVATYGIPAVIVRPFNNFGPYQHLEKVIPRFVTSCLLGESLTVHGDGRAARDFLHVDDHCDALELLLDTDLAAIRGEVFNVGSGRHRTLLELAESVRERMACAEIPIELVDDRPGQVFRHTGDASKIERALGWKPRIDFDEGLDRTIAWYRDHVDWWRPQIPMRRIPIVSASGRRTFH